MGFKGGKREKNNKISGNPRAAEGGRRKRTGKEESQKSSSFYTDSFDFVEILCEFCICTWEWIPILESWELYGHVCHACFAEQEMRA